MLKAHTVIAMIATVMLLWGLSVVFRGLGARLPQFRRRPQREPRRARRVSLPLTVFGALVAAGSAPVFWSSLQVNRWQRSFDPTIEPFTPWTGVALGMVAFGAGLVAWGLRGDRPRGRRRCPRCWYDMTGARGLTCPECGREAADADELLLPRRKGRMIAAGVAIALLAIVPYYTPRVQRGGWVAVVPTTGLILGLPWWPDEAVAGGIGGKDDWSLLGRLEEDALFPWQERLLRSRVLSLEAATRPSRARRLGLLAAQSEDAELLERASGLLLAHALDETLDDGERLALLDLGASTLAQLRWAPGDADPATVVQPHVPALAAILGDEYMGAPAARALFFAEDLTVAADPLIAAFRAPSDWVLPTQRPDIAIMRSDRFPEARALVQAAESNAAAQETLLDALEGQLSPHHRLSAILALRWDNISFPGLGEALAPLMGDPQVAIYTAGVLRGRPALAPPAIAQLAGAIEASHEPDERLLAAAAHLAGAGLDPEGDLERLLSHPSRDVRLAIALQLADPIGSGAQGDLNRLLAVLRDLQATAPPDESPGTADQIQTAIGQVEDAISRR